MEIIIIAAMAENRVIGQNNALPWSLKEDMAHFKELTTGWPCIMGRKTWESLPKRPLPGRLNVIISRMMPAQGASQSVSQIAPQMVLQNTSRIVSHIVPQTVILSSLQEAIRHCRGYQKIFICGGASIYREALAVANKIELTVIHRCYDGDVFFPEVNPAQWEKTASMDFDGFSFISYKKKSGKYS
jgi:dihydrofolate reductase